MARLANASRLTQLSWSHASLPSLRSSRNPSVLRTTGLEPRSSYDSSCLHDHGLASLSGRFLNLMKKIPRQLSIFPTYQEWQWLVFGLSLISKGRLWLASRIVLPWQKTMEIPWRSRDTLRVDKCDGSWAGSNEMTFSSFDKNHLADKSLLGMVYDVQYI